MNALRNTFSQTVLASVVAVVLLTGSAQASWYNPMTWFGSEAQPAQVTKDDATPVKKPALKIDDVKPAAAENGAIINTERGKIVIRFFEAEAPKTVANFKKLTREGFYNAPGMVFHRVVEDFVVQTGDPTGTGYGGSDKTIPLEVDNNLTHNSAGIVAMARGPLPNSATSQFYITLSKQSSLDGKYAIFGEVLQGLDVVSSIKKGDRVYGVALADVNDVVPENRKAYGKKPTKYFGFF